MSGKHKEDSYKKIKEREEKKEINSSEEEEQNDSEFERGQSKTLKTLAYSEYSGINRPVKKKGSVLVAVFSTMLLTNFANFYIFDIPQLFEGPFIKKFDITTVEISYLYAIYSIPNFIFAPLGSVLLNHTGLGVGAILFSGIIFASTLIMFLGVNMNSFHLVLIARAIFGIGAETLIVCQATMAEKWFTGKFLSIAIGLNNVLNLSGSALSAYLTPTLFVKSRNLQVPLFFCSVIVFICWVSSFIYLIIEWRNVKMIQDEDEEDEVKFSLRHIKFLGKLFWILAVVFSFISMSYYQFTNFVTDFLMRRFSYDYLDAKNLVALIPLVVCGLIPFLSVIVVWIGKKGYVLILAGFCAFGSYFYLETLPNEPSTKVTISIIMIGVFFSLYSSVIWTSMALVVPKQATSVALGIATTIQNILMTTLPIVFGAINKSRTPKAYNTSLRVLQGMAICATIFSVIVTITDKVTGKKLDLPENDKSVLEQRSVVSEEFRRSTVFVESIMGSVGEEKLSNKFKGAKSFSGGNK